MAPGRPHGFARAKKNGRSSKTASTRVFACATYSATLVFPAKSDAYGSSTCRPGTITGWTPAHEDMRSVSSAVKGRFLSMKIICGGSSRSPLRVSRRTATRWPASSGPSSATEFATRRGASTSQRRMTSSPSGVRWSR